RAKNPYTTVGIPARISRMGFNVERAFSEAYSLRNRAAASPRGSETHIAIKLVIRVEVTRGQIPNFPTPGDHSVPPKNLTSVTAGSLKKSKASLPSSYTMARVMKMDKIPAVNS